MYYPYDKYIMWIFTTLINFFTELITHLILIFGILGTITGLVLSMIPALKKYSLIITPISIIILLFGVYQEGKLANDKEWQAKVVKLEGQLKEAEDKSNKTNTKIVTKLVTQQQVIKEKGDTVIEYVEREVAKHDKECSIPDSAIIAHNTAAKNKSMDEVLTPNSQLKTDEHNKAANPNKMILPKK